MTSYERVFEVLSHREPDRVPLDFSANAATLERLHGHLGTRTHRELLDRLHVDILDIRGVVDPVYRGPVPFERLLPGGVKENIFGWRMRRMETATGPEDCFCDFALAGATSIREIEAHPWPDPAWFDFSGFEDGLKPFGDLVIMASGASVFQHPSFLRGIENLLADLVEAPEVFEALSDRFTDFYLSYFERMFRAAKGKINLFRIADDLGQQDRLMFSPSHFDRFLAPRLEKLIALGHRHGLSVMFHSCGAVLPLLDRLIALGMDILDPIQVRAKGMDPGELKRRYGERLVFHGGIDTQYLLPRGSPAEVAGEVHRIAGILGRGGGYILAPSHVLQTDVPMENILALYETGWGGGHET